MLSGHPVVRPDPGAIRRYDFDFTCEGEWLYLASFDELTATALKNHQHSVETHGERWRIVEARTGAVVARSARRRYFSWLQALVRKAPSHY